jgi:hypothetical protein
MKINDNTDIIKKISIFLFFIFFLNTKNRNKTMNFEQIRNLVIKKFINRFVFYVLYDDLPSLVFPRQFDINFFLITSE